MLGLVVFLAMAVQSARRRLRRRLHSHRAGAARGRSGDRLLDLRHHLHRTSAASCCSSAWRDGCCSDAALNARPRRLHPPLSRSSSPFSGIAGASSCSAARRGETRSATGAGRRGSPGTVADLGPAFIKLAQVFAARADILPEPYLSAIGTLTDQVPPLPPGVAEAVIRGELGEDAGRIFERFDAEPLAAASLGQVHRASYRGREVVVKVLRPGRRGGGAPRPRRLLPDPLPPQPAVSRPSGPGDHRDRERVLQADRRRARLPRGGPQRGDAEAELRRRAEGGGARGRGRPGAAAGAGARVRRGHPDRPAAAAARRRASCGSTR